jgi:adenylate cyclase
VAATRRLAAVMFTDMVGYTASTQADEARTLGLLRDQEELVRPLVAAHHGREIKSTGDGFLVEFDSALRATQCAVDIQRRIHDRNAEGGLPLLQIRIGIHLGDVVESGKDILGDAVNIAARIEPIAEPGGVCVSGAVHEQVWNKVPDKFERLPSKVLKGVQASTEVYRVVLPWTVEAPASPDSGPTGLAVLPFANISPDPKDEYFADGLTEEIITVLSQLVELQVIARTSVMQYKATTKAVSQIGAELGVTSVLEGSVRKAGTRLRITAQLIDAQSQRHVWANTYDRELDDVFSVQAEIARNVAEALKVQLRGAEEARLRARRPVRSDSYLAYLKGRTLTYKGSRAALQDAKEQFELAISLDPTNAAAHSGLADATWLMGIWYTDTHQTAWVETSERSAERAIQLNPNLAEAHASLALSLWKRRDYPATEKELKLALSLNPSYSMARRWYAGILQDEGRAEEALRELTLAEAADPLGTGHVDQLASLLIELGRLDEAFVKIERLREMEPSRAGPHVRLAQYYLARSEFDQCLKEVQRAEELEPEPRMKRVFRVWRHVLSGEKEKARALLREEETLPEYGIIPYYIAILYAELEDMDECFRWLERQGPSLPLQSLRLDPRLDNVRRDPRFQDLLKKMNLA